MRVGSAGHCDGPRIIPQSVCRFILHRLPGRLLGEGFIEAAALDHKARDDTMKHSVAVVAILYIAQKIIHGLGSLVGIEFHRHIAQICPDLNLRIGGVAGHVDTKRKSNDEKSGNMHDGKVAGNRVVG